MPRTMSRFARSLCAAALLTVSLASCGSDLLDLAQVWQLQTVQDASLPFTVPDASHDQVITSGVANLHSDNSYDMTFTGTLDGEQGQVGSDAGHWSVTSGTFTFHSTTTGGTYVAALVGSNFNASVPGVLVGSTQGNFAMLFAKIP